MRALRIRGGSPLEGTVTIHGAKNGVLPLLAAAVAVGDVCTLYNCPEISDVDTTLQLIEQIGCRVERRKHTVKIDSTYLSDYKLDPELVQRMRSSVLFLGALLARCKQCDLSCPGGCVLGKRPIDLHLAAVEQMGGSVHQEGEILRCRAEQLHGATILLPFPSVGATQNILLLATGADGPVTVLNCAREPEVTELVDFLCSAGLRISGRGSSVLRIEPGKLHGCSHSVLPDRIEAATYLSCVACAGGHVLLTRCCPKQLAPVLEVYRACGAHVQEQKNRIDFCCEHLTAAPPIRTAPYPGFPTDAQAPVMAALCTADGISVLEETVFSSRYRHVDALRRMGADIRLGKSIAVVRGVEALHGACLEATDLRGGAAMLAAALGAKGESVLTRLQHLERGYERLPETLVCLGADISD